MPTIKISYKGDQDAHWGGWAGVPMNDLERLGVFSPGRGDRHLKIAASDFPIRAIDQPGVRVPSTTERSPSSRSRVGTHVADALQRAGAGPD